MVSLTKMPELLFILLEKCFAFVLIHLCRLILGIDDTLTKKYNKKRALNEHTTMPKC